MANMKAMPDPPKMKLSDYDQRKLEEFFESVEPILSGYHDIIFCYLALKRDQSFELHQGRVILSGHELGMRSQQFESQNIKAGICRLKELSLDLRTLVNLLIEGKLETPSGTLCFPSDKERYSVYFDAFHDTRDNPQHRLKRLSIRGEGRHGIRDPLLEWELKAAATPFENIEDLCTHFHLGKPEDNSVSVEFIALNIIAVATESIIRGEKATIAIHIAAGLRRDKARLGFRLFHGGKIVMRGMTSGADMKWKLLTNAEHGEFELMVPEGSVIHCIASFNGEAQHQYWVTDPSTTPNPFRAVYQALDAELSTLREYLARSPAKGEARDLEAGVARLFWMHGFTVLHFGGNARGGPDILASTPSGNMIVIECTTGILKPEKFTLLLERARKIKESLAHSGNWHLRVLPFIVTTKSREDTKPDLEQAQKLGIYVVTRDEINVLLEKSLILPHPEQLFNAVEAELQKAVNTDPYGRLVPE
jgi:hypothetical protein